MRKKSQSLPSQSIAEVPFTFHFPNNQHIFTLNLPLEIKVRELTEILNSFTKLHQKFGEKMPNRVSRPKYLSYSSNILIDYFLQNQITSQCTFACLLKCKKYSRLLSSALHFNIVYTSQSITNSERRPQYVPLYKITERKNGEEVVVRSERTGSMYCLQRKPKQQLKFDEFEQLIILRNSMVKWEKDGLFITVNIEETYQSQNYLNVITTFLPIRLSAIKIKDRQIFETYFSQIARIIYLLYKEGFNPEVLTLADFGLTFSHKVFIASVLSLSKARKQKKQEIKIEQDPTNYNSTMTKIWEEIMKNCEYLIIEYYLPFYHYLKNGKICAYSDFLRYFQLQRKQVITPRNAIFYGNNGNNLNQTVSRILEETEPLELTPILEQEQKEFDKSFTPETSLFSYHSPSSISPLNPQEFQLQSTIKKPRPKPKKKSNISSHIQNKSFKTKKHDRNISEFLLNK